VKKTINFTMFIKRLQQFQQNPRKFGKLMQAVSDGRIDIDRQTKSFLAESCRVMRLFSGDMFAVDIADTVKAVEFNLIFYKDNQQLAVIDYPLSGSSFEINNITPADYRLMTSTGVVLWQRRLTPQDMLIIKSFGRGGRFRMVADSGDGNPAASLTEELAGGEITLNVYAGVDAGRIEIISNLAGGNKDGQ